MTYDRRLIEDSLPLETISEQSAREKNIRHGHISSIHVWWGRRPLTAMRAAIFASLMPAPKDEEERQYFHELISKIVVWEATNESNKAVDDAHQIIRNHLGKNDLSVLDPFMGGGSVAFEALRLDADVYGIDVNPLAYLIGWATLVYPQRYGERLVNDVRRWGNVILEQVTAELGDLFRKPQSGYLWTYQLQCPNPECGATIPLIRDTTLAYIRSKPDVAVRIRFDDHGKPLYEIVRGAEIELGTGLRNVHKHKMEPFIHCPVCGAAVSSNYIEAEAQANRLQSVPIVSISQTNQGKLDFEIADEDDIELFKRAQKRLSSKKASSPQLIPDETIADSHMVRLKRYGIKRWSDVYNERQLLQIVTLVEKCRSVYEQSLAETNEPEYARAVLTYLSFAIDHVANMNSILSSWNARQKQATATFSRPAIPMRWDYFESALSSKQIWQAGIDKIAKSLQGSIHTSERTAQVILGDATALNALNLQRKFDLVIADPPYYDSILYGDLTDYFYVWLKRTLGDQYPEAFATTLTSDRGTLFSDDVDESDEHSYLANLEKSFSQIYECLKTDGIMVLLFPYKPSKALDDVFESIIRQGFDISALWPFRTETSLRITTSADVASTLLVIGRKRTTVLREEGQFIRVRAQVRKEVRDHLRTVRTHAGINSQDLLIQVFSVALRIFTQYRQIVKSTNGIASLRDVLNIAQEEMGDYLLLAEHNDE